MARAPVLTSDKSDNETPKEVMDAATKLVDEIIEEAETTISKTDVQRINLASSCLLSSRQFAPRMNCGQTPIGNRIRPRTRKRIRQTNFRDNLKTRDHLLSKIIRNLPSRFKSPSNRLGPLAHRQFLCRGVPRIRISIIWKPDRKPETN
ncbi:unnamed protein product [Nesidiocoris tenuis]|uniref:Uncharacterized protein n=1 Tax=Nesidiocoris tenuis TaxID=355587 RepID=A0A6H5HK46_9HEMI|nr:unnamed protein product [Nesidiocoris tenuis]